MADTKYNIKVITEVNNHPNPTRFEGTPTAP